MIPVFDNQVFQAFLHRRVYWQAGWLWFWSGWHREYVVQLEATDEFSRADEPECGPDTIRGPWPDKGADPVSF